MVEQAQFRIQEAMTALVDDLDKTYLRGMQVGNEFIIKEDTQKDIDVEIPDLATISRRSCPYWEFRVFIYL